MRDFDELFFFAGASESDIAKFADETTLRSLTLQNLGAFWSLSCGADFGKCIRELGGLYDRALRAHAFRVGVAISSRADSALAIRSGPRLKSVAASCDRTLLLTERQPTSESELPSVVDDDHSEEAVAGVGPLSRRAHNGENSFYLHSPGVWDDVLAVILSRK